MDERSAPLIPQARILVVEDEPTTRKAICRALELMGYDVDQAGSGELALARLASLPCDLMLLDLRLPGMDGIEVMRRVQESHPDLLVIVLTAHATLESAVAAVKAGATDYLLKPSSIKEIEVAISRALQHKRERLRRQHLIGVISKALDELRTQERREMMATPQLPERFLAHGPISLDREKRLVVVRAGQDSENLDAELTAYEVALLAFLMQHPDKTFSCRELARGAFDYRISEQEARGLVRPHISRLRKKIEVDAARPRLIRTIRGEGYLFSVR